MLELFNLDRPEWTVRALAAAINCPIASTYRIVNTLTSAGYLVAVDGSGTYRLGSRLLRVGALALADLDVRLAALPVMQRLAQETGETALLLVPSGHQAVCVAKVEGTYPIRPRSFAVGEVVPYNAGALPMAIFAALPDEAAAPILAEGMHRFTQQSAVDVDELQARCSQIRERGYAYSEEEFIVGTAAVAAPIFGGEGLVLGSIGLTGVAERVRGLEATVVAEAGALSNYLGSF